ncbi:FAD-linked sulfhydryl oxidase ERV2 [Hypsizygus marmoreus]|uniref:Sulfhydryl oxidase n=1 Tax=Hypsizygus marmoreus TaxID=39966 RepID=A0A369JEJ9_HYPMA|nr:FAD-linked sulfhydryl oxidase ERV2 [Hypsizygus marmoreus]
MISRFAKTFVVVIAALLLLTMVAFIHPPSLSYVDPWTGQLFGEGGVEKSLEQHPPLHPPGPVNGSVIMPKLGNATAKATLGRATWKLLHTMTLRYPENPTPDERTALVSYFHLTSRLYPCGECAEEFQLLLKKFPPQTSSRRSASLWLCFLHNQVNTRLHKPPFDCAHLDAEYDCGCIAKPPQDPMDLEEDLSVGKDGVTGAGMIKGGR